MRVLRVACVVGEFLNPLRVRSATTAGRATPPPFPASMRTLLFLAALTLGACSTAERVADDAVTVARGAADAVEDAAGAVYGSAADLFDEDDATYAAALVRPTTAPNTLAQGTVTFRESDGGLMVSVSLSGLQPGTHAVHIHETPDCGPGDADGDGRDEPGGAAGGHWDPLDSGDHGASSEDLSDKHLGDLGNVEAGADGRAQATFAVSPFPTAEYSVADRAVMVHRGADDLESDPGGDAGARVGCGIIEGRMP